jgi:hypothetical protein
MHLYIIRRERRRALMEEEIPYPDERGLNIIIIPMLCLLINAK